MMTDPNATIADAETLAGQVLSGRYEIVEKLGDGSMGIVFLAQHTHMKKNVALKVMRDEFLENPEAVERFQREAQAAGHIDHPNVCAATDFGQLEDGRFFLVMEYIDGQTLGYLLGEEGRLSAERAVHITRQIASGLQRAHELDVIHRDLKPENVLLVEREGDPDFVKITDFGVARVEVVNEQKLTQAGRTMGTPVYMSPEQAIAARAEERSDLYTVGIMLYEMLTGSVPFRSDSLAVILSMHRDQKPKPMHDIAPEALIPVDLVSIVDRLLQKDPEDRFSSAEALIDALDSADLSPYVPALDGPSEPGELSSAPASSAVSPDEVRGDGAIEETVGVHGLEPISEVIPDFPAPSKGKTFSEIFDDLPMKGLGVGLAVFGLVFMVALGGIFLSDGEDEPLEEGEAIAFSEDEVAPAGLEDEQEEFIGDHDLEETLASAGPADAVAALEKLEGEAAENPHRHYLLARFSMDAGEGAAAMPSYAAAVAKDPRYANDARLISDAGQQLASNDDGDAAIPVFEVVLESAPTGPGLTALYDVAVGGNWKARKRASDTLEKTGTFESLESWQKTAIELRKTGKQCEKVQKLVNELAESGEPRALPVVRKTSKRPKSGCGLFKKGDCYKCARDDIRKAIETLEAAQP